MKINHIGYAVKDVAGAARRFEALGYKSMKPPFRDDGRNVTIHFLEKDGYVIELVSPTSTASPVSMLLSKVGNSPYHVCYEVPAIGPAMEELKGQGYLVVAPPADAPAMGGKKVAFLAHKELGMIELVEGEGI